MAIKVSDLSDPAAKKAWEIYQQQCRANSPDVRERRGKFGAIKEDRGKIRFDSKKEARRYDALLVLLAAGAITELKIQPEFTLTEAYTTPEGERVRAWRYRADFSYKRHGVLIVEDVKSSATRTRVYINNCKMMREKYGIEVQEVTDC